MHDTRRTLGTRSAISTYTSIATTASSGSNSLPLQLCSWVSRGLEGACRRAPSSTPMADSACMLQPLNKSRHAGALCTIYSLT
jgi:hypothetical protein